MKRMWPLNLLLALTLSVPIIASPQERTPLEEQTITMDSFRAIQAAMPEVERWKININSYRIAVREEVSSFVIVFYDKITDKNQLGSPEGRPSLVVEISKDKFSVIRSYIAR